MPKTIAQLMQEPTSLVLAYADIESLAAAADQQSRRFAGKPGEAKYARIRDEIYRQFPTARPVTYNAD